jgi:hypothetical protein
MTLLHSAFVMRCIIAIYVCQVQLEVENVLYY